MPAYVNVIALGAELLVTSLGLGFFLTSDASCDYIQTYQAHHLNPFVSRVQIQYLLLEKVEWGDVTLCML